MRLPKLRELREAVTAVFSPRFTTRFPAKPCVVPSKYRGKPEFDLESCIGCGACVNACPTEALTQIEDLAAEPAVRILTLRYDTCIFCGNCHDICTTDDGIRLSTEWNLATMDRASTIETHAHELQLCERCGAVIGTKKHLVWLYEKLGPLAYSNPSLLLAKSGELETDPQGAGDQQHSDESLQTTSFMRILCPKCKYELNIKL